MHGKYGQNQYLKCMMSNIKCLMVDYMSDVDNKIWKVDYKRLMVDYIMCTT